MKWLLYRINQEPTEIQKIPWFFLNFKSSIYTEDIIFLSNTHVLKCSGL